MPSLISRHIVRLSADDHGGVAIVGALLLPVLVGAMGFAVDYTFASRDRAALQATSDATALALARELSIARPNATRIQAIGESIAQADLKRRNLDKDATVTAVVQDEKASVRVDITRPRRSFFASLIGQTPGSIGVTSGANLAGRRKICVVALDPAAPAAVDMKQNAWLTAEGCDVFANSTDADAIETESGNRIEASLTCSAGGISGAGDLRGERLTDCPPVPDPLASRPAPREGLCLPIVGDLVDVGLSALSRLLVLPGTYCNGLRIRGKSFAHFLPGVYIIKNGEFRIDDDADVTGNHVSFYLSGEKAKLKFKNQAKVWLNAPKNGPMAGLLFFEDRSVSLNREHDVTSDFVENMTGTIYLPRGKLVVDAMNAVAQKSAFTLIVANQVSMSKSPRLVVNSDYGLTDVPVPSGLGFVTGPVRLTD